MEYSNLHSNIYNETHQGNYPLGHYMNDATYDLPNEGEYEDMRLPCQNFIICKRSYTGATVDEAVNLTEELLIKFDSFNDFIDYVHKQPRKGSVRFTTERYFLNSLNAADVIAGCQGRGHYYDILYSNGSYIVCWEKYRPDGTMYDSFFDEHWMANQTPTFPLFVDEYVKPISLESINFSREFGPKFNGQVFFNVTRSWKTLEPDDTDRDGEPYTPETPPWMKRLESMSVSHEAIDETVEYVYPDWKTGGAWTVQLINRIKSDASISAALRQGLVSYILSYFGVVLGGDSEVSDVTTAVMKKLNYGKTTIDPVNFGLQYPYTLTQPDMMEKRTESEGEYRKRLYANTGPTYIDPNTLSVFEPTGLVGPVIRNLKRFHPDLHVALGEGEYAETASDSDGGVFVYREDYEYILSQIAVAFTNSAGLAMEAQGSRQILKLDFSYNVKDFDFQAPAYFMNKVNDSAIAIAGVTYGPKMVLIQDIGAEYKVDYNEDGSVKWSYWTIKLSLLIDNRSFNRDYANIGTHVIETDEVIHKKGSYVPDDYTPTNVVYRLGSGKNKGMILSSKEYNEMKDKGIDFEKQFGCTPAKVNIFADNPSKTEHAPRLDTYLSGYVGESNTLTLSGTDFDAPRKRLQDLGLNLEDVKNGKYEILRRHSLMPIYRYEGHYYTRRQLDAMRPSGDEEQITEPMFLSMNGESLSPFMGNGTQYPVYLRGCVYDSADFTALGIPAVG